MDNSQSSDASSENIAQKLVGKFLQNFALMEQALDMGIGTLLGLTRRTSDIVCSNIPFTKNVNIFFSAKGLFAAIPDGKREKNLKAVRSEIMELNQMRVMFAHNLFQSHEGGISFRRVVADNKLKVSTEFLTGKQVTEFCHRASNLVVRIDNLVNEMVPYTPTLDFSDARNSGYVVFI